MRRKKSHWKSCNMRLKNQCCLPCGRRSVTMGELTTTRQFLAGTSRSTATIFCILKRSTTMIGGLVASCPTTSSSDSSRPRSRLKKSERTKNRGLSDRQKSVRTASKTRTLPLLKRSEKRARAKTLTKSCRTSDRCCWSAQVWKVKNKGPRIFISLHFHATSLTRWGPNYQISKLGALWPWMSFLRHLGPTHIVKLHDG